METRGLFLEMLQRETPSQIAHWQTWLNHPNPPEFPFDPNLMHAQRVIRYDATYRRERGLNGQALDVLKSGLQKYIRRAQLEQARWTAAELDLFRYAPNGEGERLRTGLIHRLRVIALEDIGLANPQAICYVAEKTARLKTLQALHKTQPLKPAQRLEEMELILGCVERLAASPHARVLSHWRAAFLPKHLETQRLYERHPELYAGWNADPTQVSYTGSFYPRLSANESTRFAPLLRALFDCLERRDLLALTWIYRIREVAGVELKRYRRVSVETLLLEALVWFVEQRRGLFPSAAAHRWAKATAENLVAWYLDMTVKEMELCAPLIAGLVIYADKIRWEQPQPSFDPAETPRQYARNYLGLAPELDSFIVDIHTKDGRARGMTALDFAVEGAWVANEAAEVVDERMKAIYVESKTW